MRPERGFEDRGKRDEEGEEKDDREKVTHSFSPDLSTA